MPRCGSCGAELASAATPCPLCGPGSAGDGDTLTRWSPPPAPATPPPASRFVPGTVLLGRYRIVAPLGRGGMGEVFHAEDLKLGHTVALKFLPPALARDSDWLARFHGEVRVARR